MFIVVAVGTSSWKREMPRAVSGPVDPLREIGWAEVDQAAALHLAILAAGEREPVNLALARLDDQDLVHVVSGIERQLLPALVARRGDLHHERHGGVPDGAWDLSVKGAVGHAEVVLGGAEVDLVHRRYKARGTGR